MRMRPLFDHHPFLVIRVGTASTARLERTLRVLIAVLSCYIELKTCAVAISLDINFPVARQRKTNIFALRLGIDWRVV